MNQNEQTKTAPSIEEQHRRNIEQGRRFADERRKEQLLRSEFSKEKNRPFSDLRTPFNPEEATDFECEMYDRCGGIV